MMRLLNQLLSTGSSLNFSDNYCEMLPNSACKVIIKKEKNQSIEEFKSRLKIQSLVDSY